MPACPTWHQADDAAAGEPRRPARAGQGADQALRRRGGGRRHRLHRCSRARCSASPRSQRRHDHHHAHVIACVSPITDGEARVPGMNPVHDGAAIRARIGVVPQEDNLDTELTVADNLLIYGRYRAAGLGHPRAGDRAAGLRPPRRPARLAGRPATMGHEAPAHHRPGARQPARAALARRAHHRPRPPGAPPAAGSASTARARASPRC